MTRATILALLLATSFAAAPVKKPAAAEAKPATRSATQRAADELGVLGADVKRAEASLATAQAKCRERTMASKAYRDAAAAEVAKLKRLEAARAGGAPADKLAASAAYTKSRAVTQKLLSDAAAKDGGIADAHAALKDAKLRLSKARLAADARREQHAKAAAEREANDPINIAIAARRLAIGMTLEQANTALGFQGKLTSETGVEQTYEWFDYVVSSGGGFGAAPSGGGRILGKKFVASATLVAGKIVSYDAN